MIFSLMTVDTLKIISSHMDIDIFGGKVQTAVQVAMLNPVTTSAIKMTASAVGAGRAADTLCNRYQINFFRRLSGSAFDIASGLLMTNQAVNIAFYTEVKIGVFPAISRMTACASFPV